MQVHTDIIYINSNAFHKVIKHYDNIKERIKSANSLNTEFWESVEANKSSRAAAASITPQSEIEIEGESTDSRMFSKSGSRTQTLTKLAKKTIKHNSLFYQIWVQIMCFHVAAISSLVTSYFIFMSGEETFFYFTVFKYTLDVLYLSKIYIGFRLSYLNPDSGLIVTDLNTIGWKYFKRMFWMDLFTLFPADVLLMLLGKSSTWVKYFSINRIFRYVYMVMYHNDCKYKLKVSMYVRWSYLIYDIMFATQILTCIWWLCACNDNMCSYRKDKDENKQEFVKEKSNYISNLLAYQYIINLFTISGLRSTTPLTKLQVFVTIFITLISQYITAVVARAVASYLVVKYSEMSEYEYNIQELRDYLKVSFSFRFHLFTFLTVLLEVLPTLKKFCRTVAGFVAVDSSTNVAVPPRFVVPSERTMDAGTHSKSSLLPQARYHVCFVRKTLGEPFSLRENSRRLPASIGVPFETLRVLPPELHYGEKRCGRLHVLHPSRRSGGVRYNGEKRNHATIIIRQQQFRGSPRTLQHTARLFFQSSHNSRYINFETERLERFVEVVSCFEGTNRFGRNSKPLAQARRSASFRFSCLTTYFVSKLNVKQLFLTIFYCRKYKNIFNIDCLYAGALKKLYKNVLFTATTILKISVIFIYH